MDNLSDLAFFTCIHRFGSLVGAAQELGVTPPAVSKRLAGLEARLGVRLLYRTTRRISLTAEGERYLTQGAHILEAIGELEGSISGMQSTPQGLLKVGATLGFGRRYIAPALSAFAQQFPAVELQLHLSERPMNLVDLGLDVVIHFGEISDARLSARLLARNRRVLCAAPAYLTAEGMPLAPKDLARHQCIFIRESDEIFGTWHLMQGAQQVSVKVRGGMSTNDGESAVAWALEGRGVLMRSLWDVAPHLRSGALQRVLPAWELAPADIYMVFPTAMHRPVKVRAIVDFLLDRFARQRGPSDDNMTELW